MVAEWRDETNENYRYAIRQESIGILGHIALLQGSEGGLPNIGYWLGEEYTGQGIAKRATQTLTDFAHEELSTPILELEIRGDNEPSKGVARSAGYNFVAERVKDSSDTPYEVWHSVRNG